MFKTFIDDAGTFEIKVPFTWKYSLHGSNTHTFQEYEIWKPDSFQFSIKHLQGTEIAAFQEVVKNFPKVDINGVEYYEYPEIENERFLMRAWARLANNDKLLFTYVYLKDVDLDLDSRTVEEKIEAVTSSIKSFSLISDFERNTKLSFYRFDMFLQGFGATALILSKAVENKAFIEATCILASQIDALLRIGIVLKKQIISNSSDIDLEWVYQGLTDKKRIERDVYKKAKEMSIIDNIIFDELNLLYNDRNRIIHRFIISEITLAEVEDIAYKYYKLREKVNNIVYSIEEEQISLNVGMTKRGGNGETADHLEYIKGKIGKQNYFENKS